jgi:hypothetical protein
VEDRGDKVVAVDFARRAAIAAQSQAATVSLLDKLDAAPFGALIAKPGDPGLAYASTHNSNARIGDRSDLKA